MEAHGTGTSLGDPIEVQALAAVLGPGRAAGAAAPVGSVKTNIGHLEAAAGMAGLIKVVLALRHGEIPAHLHFREPNPLIAWERMPVRGAGERTLWERGEGGRRIAGVSSFGFSGTNAHVVLEEWRGGGGAELAGGGHGRPWSERCPAQAARCGSRSAVERPVEVLTLSARDEAALGELASRYAAHLEAHAELRFQDVCHTANTGRAHFAAPAGGGGERRAAEARGAASRAR